MTLDRLITDSARQAANELRGQLLFGRVSKAPATADDPLFVVIPQLDPRYERGPAVWAPRGSAIPAAGAAVALMLDDRDRPWVVAWEGPFTLGAAPSGPAGGDLAGTYPNPQIAAGVVGEPELAALAVTAGKIANGAVTSAKIEDLTVVDGDVNAAAAIAESKLALASDAAAATPSRRTLGTGALQACAGNDSRLSDARAPTGPAGGALAGAYPNPSLPVVVTSLPGSPVDGQEISYLADATEGVVWRFKYRAASGSSFKWEFIGGSPLEAETAAAESTSSLTYAALTTAGPSITLPLAGDYEVEQEFFAFGSGSPAYTAFMSYDIGGTGAVDGDATAMNVGGSGNVASMAHRIRRKTFVTAGTTLQSRYRAGAANSTTWQWRTMRVKPVRVG